MIVLLLLLLALPIASSAQTTAPGWRAHTPLPAPLAGHRSLLLPTGEVLVAGGITSGGAATTTSILYSPRDGTTRFTINPLQQSRAFYALVPVGSGTTVRVFAIGGYTGSATSYQAIASIEVLEFDAAQNNWRWRTVGNLPKGRGDLEATWNGAGHIVVAGGREQASGALHSGTPSVETDRIDIATLAVARIGDMNTARAEHTLVRVTDALGKPLVVAAAGETTRPTTATELLTATTWDPRANPPLGYHISGTGIGDISGTGRMFGGYDATGRATNVGEWYDVKSGWRFAPRMELERARFAMTLIAGTTDTAKAYLAVGGDGIAGAVRGTEIFSLPDGANPNGTWTTLGNMTVAASDREVAITGSNLALATGGNAGNPTAGTEIYQPFAINDVTFGLEETGRLSDSMAIVIENTWLLPLRVRNIRIDGSAEFVFFGDTLGLTVPPGGKRTIFARFRPAVAGIRTGRLLLDVGPITDVVLLQGTGVASTIGVVTSALPFDSVFVGTSQQICFPAIRNTGTDPATIDSVVLDPAGSFRVISPSGRVTIPPGDTLTVCVEFLPNARGAAQASVSAYLAGRTFPIVVTGTGIRRFASVTSPIDCDTVIRIPGTSTSSFLLLRNPSDRPVTITKANIAASASGLFALADPTALPVTLQPGGSLPIEVLFTPQRENMERATITFVTDGDTATVAALCLVARSRFLSTSVPSLDFGALCQGDSLVRTVVFENPGGFDSVTVNGVMAQDATGSVRVAPITAKRLGPHEYVTVTTTFVPSATGAFSGAIVASGSFGDVTLPVTANVLPGLRFAPGTATATAGERLTVPVSVSGISTTPVTAARLHITYNPSLLHPTSIIGVAGGVGIDAAASSLTVVGPGEADLVVAWTTPLSTDGLAFGIQSEALRGDAASTPITVEGTGVGDYCIAKASAVLEIGADCGGESGQIRTVNASVVKLAVADGRLAVDVIAAGEGEMRVEVVDLLGRSVLRSDGGYHNGPRTTVELPLPTLSSGAYFVRLSIGTTSIDQQPIVITGR